MLLRIPYTTPIPSFPAIPSNAATFPDAVRAVANLLRHSKNTLILSGAGISVESGLPDYRGSKGTYTLNKDYKPTFFGDFCNKDEARRRYWARSFLGWRGVEKVSPNRGHIAVGKLWEGGWVNGCVTQNVDSLHSVSQPDLPITNLHGTLATLLCLTCKTHFERSPFQAHLHRLNPSWSHFLTRLRDDPDMKVKTNPDGDIDVPGAPYSTFRYPPCQVCLRKREYRDIIGVDRDGAMQPKQGPTVGVLKPTVVFFGESLSQEVKTEAEQRVDGADAVLVLGSSLATYSAWRLVRRAKDTGKKIGIINLGGVRGEDGFWEGDLRQQLMEGDGTNGLRVEQDIGDVLAGVLNILKVEDNTRPSRKLPIDMDDAQPELRQIQIASSR